jgi:hypothetical protein
MQMATLLPEAKEVINDTADWMTHMFARTRSAPPAPQRQDSPKRTAERVDYSALSESDADTDADTPIFLVPRHTTPRPSFAKARSARSGGSTRSDDAAEPAGLGHDALRRRARCSGGAREGRGAGWHGRPRRAEREAADGNGAAAAPADAGRAHVRMSGGGV